MEIENNAFTNCTELKNVTLPKNVTKIGRQTFAGCSSLVFEELEIGGRTIGNGAFMQVTINNLKMNANATGASNWESSFADTKIGRVEIGKEVTEIGNELFRDAQIREIKLPDSIKIIRSYAFYGTPLTEVIIPDSVVEIENNAFTNCTELKTVTLPETVMEIGKDAFANCTNLVIVTPPGSYAERYVVEQNIQYQNQ